jgi:hypothetical protein
LIPPYIRSDTRRLGASMHQKGSTRPWAVCPKGKEWSPGGPAEVLNSYQPGTEKCNWEAAAAGENTVDLVSQRYLQLLANLRHAVAQ